MKAERDRRMSVERLKEIQSELDQATMMLKGTVKFSGQDMRGVVFTALANSEELAVAKKRISGLENEIVRLSVNVAATGIAGVVVAAQLRAENTRLQDEVKKLNRKKEG